MDSGTNLFKKRKKKKDYSTCSYHSKPSGRIQKSITQMWSAHEATRANCTLKQYSVAIGKVQF